MISAQRGTEFAGSHYEKIKKVYSIWIAIKPPVERQNTITRYRIVEENMVGHVKEPVQNYDLLTMLMICLGQPEDTECDILKLLDEKDCLSDHETGYLNFLLCIEIMLSEKPKEEVAACLHTSVAGRN